MLSEKLELEGKRVLVAHYADLLKYICKKFFGWDGNKDEKGRYILQYVGTDVIRQKMPDYWVDFIISVLELFEDNWDYVLIPDSRFPNEIEKLREKGFDVSHVRIVRPNFVSPLTEEQKKHPSETALDNIEPDIWILNAGGFEDLRALINQLMEEINHGE